MALRLRGAAGARREHVIGGGPPAERIRFGGAQRIGHAGQPHPRSFDFARPFEHGAEPLRRPTQTPPPGCRRRGRRRAAASSGRASSSVTCLGFLPQRRPALLVGVDRQRDGFDGAGGLAVGGPKTPVMLIRRGTEPTILSGLCVERCPRSREQTETMNMKNHSDAAVA